MDLPDLTHLPIVLFFAGFAVVFGLAFLFGGAPEKYGALTLLMMPTLQLILYSTVSSDVYAELDLVSITVDVFGLAAFTVIMLKADRDHWPTLAFSMALISTLAHFARVNTDMLGFSYAQFKSAPTAMIILLVFVGTITHQLRLRRNGADRDWVPLKKYAELRKLPEQLDKI